MAVIARALSHSSETPVDVETVMTIAIFCGAGLFLSLLSVACGLDLNGLPF